MDDDIEKAQNVALECLNLMVNDDDEQDCIDKFNELIRDHGSHGLKIGLNLWLANVTHELGGPMPGQMVTVEFADGADMSDVEKEEPKAAWAARMLLAYISQNEDLLGSLLGIIPEDEVVEWAYALLELCAANIRAKVIYGEDMSPTTRFIEIEDA